MQQPNSSPVKHALGLPIPASPADSGFLPRREFLPSSSQLQNSNFGILALSNTSIIRLSAFPQPVVAVLQRFLDERRLLKSYRDNRSPVKDKDIIERDKPLERSEDEDVVEFTLAAKFWANAKTLETEKLIIQILILLNSQGYSLLSPIDFGREPGDKLTLVFERPTHVGSPGQSNVNHTGGTPPGAQQVSHSGSSGGAPGTIAVRQVLFGLSFTSQTSFRCINPPLTSTPGILQALRNSWPKGVEAENKVSDGCYAFKLRGYSFLSDDTFQSDFLALALSLLRSLQKLSFTLVASFSLSNSHARNKDLWIFSSADTSAVSPTQLLNSISSSPTSYSIGTIGTSSLTHLRAASVDAVQGKSPQIPGHQRNATVPTVGSPPPQAGPTVVRGATTPTPRSHGSVLVKKHSSAKGSPKPGGANPLPSAESLTQGQTAKGSTPPQVSNTPNAGSNVLYGSSSMPSKSPGIMPSSSSKPVIAASASKNQTYGQTQQVLYSTPTSGNVLYSTPPSSPPGSYNPFPASSSTASTPFMTSGSQLSTPRAQMDTGFIGASSPSSPKGSSMLSSTQASAKPPYIDLPANASAYQAIEEEGPTPPLLSASAFRDTVSDPDRDTVLGRESTFSGGASVMSGKSGESYDVPIMWTGGLGAVGLGTTLEEREEEEAASAEGKSSPGPTVPGAWVDDSVPASPASKGSREMGKSTKKKERPFEARVEGAQLVTVSMQTGSAADIATVGDDPGRRKSQEAVVRSTGGPTKESGWVMVNVTGDQQGNKSTSSRPAPAPPGSMPPLNPSPPSSSVMETPQLSKVAAAVTMTQEPNRGSRSGDESTSSNDPTALASKAGKANAVNGGTKGKSGFRKLFGRSEKEKEKEKVGTSTTSSPTPPQVKRSFWGKGISSDNKSAPSAPARASQRMTIE
ncbi:hypothetical protein FRC16_006914 [Serendipita sp. 398]|nr:hypothetical protein FRC16_006914 [Serendipita sp. 398]